MISSHILDTSQGKPVPDVELKLFNAQDQCLATAYSNDDGRVLSTDFALSHIESGDYRIEFATEAYFTAQGIPTFFPKVVIHFSVTHPEQHYHIPLLIGPYAYSTYRGS